MTRRSPDLSESFPPTPAFEGFGPDAFAFLSELAQEQDRAWFEANKARYEAEARGPMMALVAALGTELRGLGLPFAADPKRAVFRIHKDVRFSRDKRPYKTHVGAAMTRDGEKMSPGVLYVHVDPEGSFAAAGFYRPEPAALEAIRARIAEKPALFRSVSARLDEAGLPLEPDAEALKRPPRGHERGAEPDIAAALRRKNFVVHRPLSRAELGSARLVAVLAAFARSAAPLLDFGWGAIDERRSEAPS